MASPRRGRTRRPRSSRKSGADRDHSPFRGDALGCRSRRIREPRPPRRSPSVGERALPDHANARLLPFVRRGDCVQQGGNLLYRGATDRRTRSDGGAPDVDRRGRALHRVDAIEVWRFETSFLDALEGLIDRSTQLEIVRTDARLYVTVGGTVLEGDVERVTLGEP